MSGGAEPLAAPLRPVPRTVRPMLDETVGSFVWRIAEANKLHVYDLRAHLAADDRLRAPVRADRLAAVSGVPQPVLRHAMPELCGPAELAAMPVAGRPRPGGHHRRACPKCARMPADSGGWVSLWSRHEDLVCQRHWYWTGATAAVSLAGHHDVVRANRRHRRLIRRWGREAVHRAYERAVGICRDWYEGFTWEFDRRAILFRRSPWDEAGYEAAFGAAVYPYAVALTRLMAAPYWRSLILDDHLPPHAGTPASTSAPDWETAVRTDSCVLLRTSPAIERYAAEVRRTAYPHFGWFPEPHYRRHNRFTEWVIDQLQERFHPDADRIPAGLGCAPDTLPGP